MKWAFIIPDGMGDFPIDELSGKTPLEAAFTPNFDLIAKEGRVGICNTVPDGFYPGSDVCILSLLGYAPSVYYSGRAPFEAASLKINTNPDDLIMRCNLINVSDDNRILDHCAGHITTPEACELISALSDKLGNDIIQFYPGVSYRHIAVWKNKPGFEATTTPPHDVPGEPLINHLPSGKDSDTLTELIMKSKDILKNHKVNEKRRKNNLPTADSIWLWGSGYRPAIKTFFNRFNIRGAVISAVDLIRGLAVCMELDQIQVPGITGYFDTDYRAKGLYAIEALKTHDIVIVHIEAPDEAGHVGNLQEKIRAIENIDKHVAGPVYEYLKSTGDFRILITPDHYTPVQKRIHVNHPVPFTINGKGINPENISYNEKNASLSLLKINEGHKLMPFFIGL